MSRLPGMKRELAERLASTVVDELTVGQARAVIAEFLVQLVACPLCDGGGEFIYRRPGFVDNAVRRPGKGSCPVCGSTDEDDSGRGDPDWVAWVCAQGKSVEECRRQGSSDDAENRDGHEVCGYRVVLPLPVDDTNSSR